VGFHPWISANSHMHIATSPAALAVLEAVKGEAADRSPNRTTRSTSRTRRTTTKPTSVPRRPFRSTSTRTAHEGRGRPRDDGLQQDDESPAVARLPKERSTPNGIRTRAATLRGQVQNIHPYPSPCKSMVSVDRGWLWIGQDARWTRDSGATGRSVVRPSDRVALELAVDRP
jgi:hypothetical protein